MEKYERMKMVVKKIMREAKKKTNEEWRVSIADNFKENEKKLWKGLNEVRKEEESWGYETQWWRN